MNWANSSATSTLDWTTTDSSVATYITSTAQYVTSCLTYLVNVPTSAVSWKDLGYLTSSDFKSPISNKTYKAVTSYEKYKITESYVTGDTDGTDTLDKYIITCPNYINYSWDSTGSTIYVGDVSLTPEQQAEFDRQRKRMEFIARIKSCGIIVPKTKSLSRIDESTPEGRARGLLREMIGDKEFARYLRRGCLEVTGRSGLKYVIYGNTIHVFAKTLDGKMKKVESICLVFRGHAGLPPTDHVIMRKMMIETNEFAVREIGNRFNTTSLEDVEPSSRKLLELKRSA